MNDEILYKNEGIHNFVILDKYDGLSTVLVLECNITYKYNPNKKEKKEIGKINGNIRFTLLDTWLIGNETTGIYYIFDCLWINGENVNEYGFLERMKKCEVFLVKNSHKNLIIKEYRTVDKEKIQDVIKYVNETEFIINKDVKIGIDCVIFQLINKPYPEMSHLSLNELLWIQLTSK
jgi:hypothetical protein